MVTTVIFDMDGLMFDTERLSNDAFYATQDILGIKVEPQMLAEMKGANREACTRIMRRYFGEEADLDYYREVRQVYIENYFKEHGMPVKKGLYNLLAYLKENHYKIVLATSTARTSALRFLKMAGVDHYFDYCVFGDMVTKSKPEPDIFLEAVRQASEIPQNCLVLEDSYNGVEAGVAAGCHVVMIPDCVPANERMYEIADAVMPSLEDLLEKLTDWN